MFDIHCSATVYSKFRNFCDFVPSNTPCHTHTQTNSTSHPDVSGPESIADTRLHSHSLASDPTQLIFAFVLMTQNNHSVSQLSSPIAKNMRNLPFIPPFDHQNSRH